MLKEQVIAHTYIIGFNTTLSTIYFFDPINATAIL